MNHELALLHHAFQTAPSQTHTKGCKSNFNCALGHACGRAALGQTTKKRVTTFAREGILPCLIASTYAAYHRTRPADKSGWMVSISLDFSLWKEA